MGFRDNVTGRVRRAIRLTLNELGRRGVATIREVIGVRVQYIGTEIIRSEPGEPPRREFSVLWKSIKYRVRARAKGIEDLIIYTNDPKAPLLEDGTFKMEPRPFWFTTWRRIKPHIKRDFFTLFRQYFNESGGNPNLKDIDVQPPQ